MNIDEADDQDGDEVRDTDMGIETVAFNVADLV